MESTNTSGNFNQAERLPRTPNHCLSLVKARSPVYPLKRNNQEISGSRG